MLLNTIHTDAERKLLSGAGEIFLCKSVQVDSHSKKGDPTEPRNLVSNL